MPCSTIVLALDQTFIEMCVEQKVYREGCLPWRNTSEVDQVKKQNKRCKIILKDDRYIAFLILAILLSTEHLKLVLLTWQLWMLETCCTVSDILSHSFDKCTYFVLVCKSLLKASAKCHECNPIKQYCPTSPHCTVVIHWMYLATSLSAPPALHIQQNCVSSLWPPLMWCWTCWCSALAQQNHIYFTHGVIYSIYIFKLYSRTVFCIV